MPKSPKTPKSSTVDDAIAALDSVRRSWLRRPGVSAVDVGFKISGDELTDKVASRGGGLDALVQQLVEKAQIGTASR